MEDPKQRLEIEKQIAKHRSSVKELLESRPSRFELERFAGKVAAIQQRLERATTAWENANQSSLSQLDSASANSQKLLFALQDVQEAWTSGDIPALDRWLAAASDVDQTSAPDETAEQ